VYNELRRIKSVVFSYKLEYILKKNLIAFAACLMVSGATFAAGGANTCRVGNVSGGITTTDCSTGSATGGTAYGGVATTTSGPATTTSGPAATISGPATTTGGTAYGGVGGTVGNQTANNSNAGIVGQGGNSTSASSATGGAGGAGGNSTSTNVNANSATGGSSTSTSAGGSATSNSGGNTIITVDENSLAIAEANAAASVEAARLHADAIKHASEQKIRNTPSVSAAALTSSNDTCMGSVSAGGSGPGFSLTVGSTYKDDNCVMLKNSRELWNMGFKAAALALMCTDAANRRALEVTGYECPTGKAPVVVVTTTGAAPVVTEQAEPTDPYVRRRMGLPAVRE
jgi:hypothetical protein